MKLVIDIAEEEYLVFKLAYESGMGNTAMKHILNATPLEEVLGDIDFAIKATNLNDTYSVGLRNGLRLAKSFIDDDKPVFEECTEQTLEEVLGEIKREIEKLIDWHDCPIEYDNGNDAWYREACNTAISIIDSHISGKEKE